MHSQSQGGLRAGAGVAALSTLIWVKINLIRPFGKNHIRRLPLPPFRDVSGVKLGRKKKANRDKGMSLSLSLSEAIAGLRRIFCPFRC